MKLYDYDVEQDGDDVTFTDPDTGAWVKMIYTPESGEHPMEHIEGVTIAFRERDRYVGLADTIPDDLWIDCPLCKGSCSTDEIWYLIRGNYGPIVGVGSFDAMESERVMLNERAGGEAYFIETGDCPRCKGEGHIEVDDIETFVKLDRGALGAHVFDTGMRGEATAVIYVTDPAIPDPAGAAKAWAKEYQGWADGDIWGIEHGSPYGETEDCWGYIGQDHAESEALSELESEIKYARKVREERREINTIRGEN